MTESVCVNSGPGQDAENRVHVAAAAPQVPTGLSSRAAAVAKNTVVYLITGTPPNDRVRKVARLSEHFNQLVLVRREPGKPKDEPAFVIRPRRNPVGILRASGFRRFAATLDRLYFPSVAVLYAKALEAKLPPLISSDLAAGRRVCVITCAPPHAVCMAGLYLKKRFPEITWIVDWQDLWSYDDNYFLTAPKFYRPRIRKIEAEILHCADVNITTNDFAKQVLEDTYGANRVVAIPHHFSRGDLEGQQISGRPTDNRGGRAITIGFLGTLFKPPRVPGSLMVDAIRQLRDAGTNVELHVHGGLPSTLPLDIAALRRDGVHLHGRTTHAAGISLLGQYDYLLVLLADLPNSEAVMSIKLPHYLLANRPILAVVPDRSAVAQIVRETGTGVVVPSKSDWTAPLKIALDDAGRAALPLRNEAAIERFSWERISQEWLRVICAPGATEG